MKLINDWEQVVLTLITQLTKDGFECYQADNCEDEPLVTNNSTKLADKVCECDEGWLYIRKGDFTARLYIVLGNSPSEIVSDYSYRRDSDLTELEASLTAFSEYWEKRGDACPKKERTY